MVSILLIIPFFVISSVGYAEDISIATINYEPYYGEKMNNDGFLAEIVKESLKSAGHTCNLKYYPWARAVNMAKTGKVDALFAVWYRKDREEYFYYSAPLPPNVVLFYQKVGTGCSFSGWDSLRNYKIGGVREYSYPEQFKNLNMDYTGSDVQNLKKLDFGRVDLIIIDKAQAEYYLNTKVPEIRGKVESINPPIAIKPQYLCISKKIKNAEKLLIDFNIGLMRITESGLLAKIREKHGY